MECTPHFHSIPAVLLLFWGRIAVQICIFATHSNAIQSHTPWPLQCHSQSTLQCHSVEFGCWFAYLRRTSMPFQCHSNTTPSDQSDIVVYIPVYGNTTLNRHLKGTLYHDDVIKWKHFPRYWPFVRGIHRSPVNSPHKGQWRGALKFSLICARINGWVNNREAGDLRRHQAHCDVIVMIATLPGKGL